MSTDQPMVGAPAALPVKKPRRTKPVDLPPMSLGEKSITASIPTAFQAIAPPPRKSAAGTNTHEGATSSRRSGQQGSRAGGHQCQNPECLTVSDASLSDCGPENSSTTPTSPTMATRAPAVVSLHN